jgi:hypothetical protein
MVNYPITPALQLRLDRILGSVDEAAEFVREWTKDHPDREWQGVLYRLEAASTGEEAADAAKALKALLEAKQLLAAGPAE